MFVHAWVLLLTGFKWGLSRESR